MTLHRSVRRALAAAFALTLLVAACGGDDDSPDDASETTAAPAASDESTTTTGDDEEPTDSSEPDEEGSDDAEAQALAESMNLTLDDFENLGEGWEEEAAEDDDDEMNECFQDVDIDAVERAEADSPDFSFTQDEQAQFVQSTTLVVDEEASGEAVIAEIGTNQFAGCAEDALIAAAKKDGVTIESGGFEPIEDEAGRGDEGVALAGDIVIVGPDGSESQGQLAYYFIRTGTVVTGVSILDIGGLGLQETLTELLDVVVERQANI